jgi:hypothetical protein
VSANPQVELLLGLMMIRMARGTFHLHRLGHFGHLMSDFIMTSQAIHFVFGYMVVVHEQNIVELFQFLRFGMTGKTPVFGNLTIAPNHIRMTTTAGYASFNGFGMIEFDPQILRRREGSSMA